MSTLVTVDEQYIIDIKRQNRSIIYMWNIMYKQAVDESIVEEKRNQKLNKLFKYRYLWAKNPTCYSHYLILLKKDAYQLTTTFPLLIPLP